MGERGMGDNSVNPEVITSFVERVESLRAEKKALSEDEREVFKEVKEAGLSTDAVREIIKIRSQDKDKRKQLQDTIEMYLAALGDFAGTPLGQAGAPAAAAA